MSQSTTLTGSKSVSSKKIEVTSPAKSVEEFSGIKWLDSIVGEYEFNRYGIYMIALLLIGIMGGIPVALGALTSVTATAILIVPTMASLVMMLGVVPMRILLWTVIVTLLIDIAMIIAMIAMWGEPLSTLF